MTNLRFYISVICILMASSVFSKGGKHKLVEKVDTISTASISLERTAVVPFGDTLFHVYGNIGSFSSKQRAASIEEKMIVLGGNYLFNEDSVKFVDFAGYLNIMYESEILMSVDSIQAAQEGKTKLDAAQFYSEQIIDAIQLQLHNTSWKQILLQIAGCIAILVAEYFAIKLILYIYRRLKVVIRLQRGKKIKGVLGVIDDQRAIMIAITALKVVRFLFIIIFLYMGLLAIFKLFPYTKHLSDELLNYVVSPIKSILRSVINYLPKLFTIIVIIVIFRYIQKFIRSVTEKIATHKINILV